jgi:hypothetical protein
MKQVKKPNIILDSFGLKFAPRSVQNFNESPIPVEEPPRVTQLAEILKASYVLPQKDVISRCYEEHSFMSDFRSFAQLSEYQKSTMRLLTKRAEELMRIVLGTQTTLWAEAFNPTFQRKCRQIANNWTEQVINFLEEDAFPRFQK